MISIDISADTAEEALAEGMRQLGIHPDALHVEVLHSAHDDTLPGAERLPGATVRISLKEDVLVAAARKHLQKILELLGIKARIDVIKRRGGATLNVNAGDDDPLIIGKSGQNLEALQVCINRMVVHGGRDLLPIYVDCGNYMEKRLSRLENNATRSARQAARDGVEVVLEPMTSFERKIVHNILKECRGIHTLSRGEGAERRIVIIPNETNIELRQLRPHRGGSHSHGQHVDGTETVPAGLSESAASEK